MTLRDYELITKWKNSQCGQIAQAKREGKSYFLKKYQTPVAPIDNGTLNAITISNNQRLFDEFVATRKKINHTIKTVSGSGGSIVIPCDEFIEGNHFFEVSEFIEGCVGIDDVRSSLSIDVISLLLQTAAGALSSIHNLGIIHSDLKPNNVLLVKTHYGNLVAKIIDFDSSYFANNKPEEIAGTIDYYSPELGAYSNAKDEDNMMEFAKKITYKSDIFSLGLLFHYYLCGELPTAVSLTDILEKRQAKGKAIYCWSVLNSGCKLKLNPAIKNVLYTSLISDMLSLDPNIRPTASQVLQRLRAKSEVIEDPWPEHRICFNMDKLAANGVVGVRKTSADKQKKYELIFKNGRRQVVDKDSIVSCGLANVSIPSSFALPWPEHKIMFDYYALKKIGFIASQQRVYNGIKGYDFFLPDLTSRFFKVEDLIMMRYARREDT